MSAFLLLNVSASQLSKLELSPSLPTEGKYTIRYGLDRCDGYFVQFEPSDDAAVEHLATAFEVIDVYGEGVLDYSTYQFTGDKHRCVDRGWIIQVLGAAKAPKDHLKLIAADLDLYQVNRVPRHFRQLQAASRY